MILDILNKLIFNLPNNTSIIILNGGVGNQIFQYFLGQELKNFYDREIIFYDIRDSYKIIHGVYIENIFEIDLIKFKVSNFNLFAKFILSPQLLKIYKFFYSRFNLKILPNLYFDNSIDLKNNNFNKYTDLYFGTWHKLINSFKCLEKKITLEFRNNFDLNNKFNFKYDFIAVHVRRGDYISSNKTSKFHGNLNKSYFLNSIDFLRKRFGNLPVLLFSDDSEWLQKNLKNIIPNSIVISSYSGTPERDLFYMSKAKYFILSNSTFSWWAAFLSQKKDKFIVIPKYWFRSFKTNKDYIFKYWNYQII